MTDILSDQIAYYRARAAEYDEWVLRVGRYDRGEAHRAEWFRELDALKHVMSATVRPTDDVLELACGTGLWTPHLSELARSVIAVDASLEAIALNRERVEAQRVRYLAADIFSWPLRRRFDLVFFGFWLSHVPEHRFQEFWALVKEMLAPSGRVLFMDGLREPTSTAVDHESLDDSGMVRRKLNDGREFQIVKVFHDPRTLQNRLDRLGLAVSVRATGKFFYYGSTD